jgi:8-oxo-dGTP pyrophosphatase MutT (NUDIX family)
MPKGHVEPGETADQAALREVAEETGLRAGIVQEVGTTRYVFRLPGESTRHTHREDRRLILVDADERLAGLVHRRAAFESLVDATAAALHRMPS